MFIQIISTLKDKQELAPEEIHYFLDAAIAGELTEEQKLEFLKLHTAKGATANELAAAAEHLQITKTQTNCLDVCGTGGSALPRINTSTLAAFVLAALDVPVAKHGNRAVTGKCGSFDLLEKMGIKIDLSPEQSTKLFEQTNLGFFFAPKCYPQMAAFGAARKALAKPSFFNLLGPLLSPLNPSKQLIGTTDRAKAELILEACRILEKKQVFVVVGADGLDEATPTGSNLVLTLANKSEITPQQARLNLADLSDITGDNLVGNVELAEQILKGELITDAKTDLVCLNVALALQLWGNVQSSFHGIAQARGALTSGIAWAKFEEYRELSQQV